MTTTDLQSAERRIAAARTEMAAQVRSLKSKARATLRSPYLIGAAAVGLAAAGYLAFVRKSSPRTTVAQAASRWSGRSGTLKWLQRLLPLIGGLGAATAAAKANPRSFPVVIPQAPDAANPFGVAPHGGWLKRQWHLTKAAFAAWSDDYAPSMGAALSYYTLFSLAPLLILVIAVAGMVFGQEAAQGEILTQMRGIMGEEGAVAIEGMLKSVNQGGKGPIATIVGIGLLLLGATAVFGELQSALDRIWRTPAPKKESGILHLLRTRLLSFGLVLGLGFLLIVSLVVSAGLAALGKWWGGWFKGWEILLEILNFAVSFGIFTLLFAMIYKLMPRARISWHDVWTGAAVTALLFTVGKVLIGLYLGKSSLASGFGAAGSLVVLLAWVYYSAQIFLLGAEYTWVYAKEHGSHSQKSSPGGAPAVPSRPG